MIQHLKRGAIALPLFLLTLLLVGMVSLFQSHSIYAQTLLPNIRPLSLHHITLSVGDADRVSRWYADNLGFTIRDRFTLTRPDGRTIDVVRIEIPGLRMNISHFDSSVSPNRTTENQGWRHIAFEVDSVDQNYQQLRARGVEFIGEPFTYDPPGYRVAFFRDPEGNTLQLYQDL